MDKLDKYFGHAMLMAITVHIFYKDWGALGSFGVLVLCGLFAFYRVKVFK